MRRTWARSGRRARPSRSPRCLPARSSRSKRSQRFSLQQQVEDYVRTLGLDAYVVGGAVRDELLGLESKDADFLVLGVDHEQLRAKLEPHGRVEDLEVAGQRVGLRLRRRAASGAPVRGATTSRSSWIPRQRSRTTSPGATLR